MGGDEARIGDHQVTIGHHGVVALLQGAERAAAEIIGAMKRRDEGQAGGAGGRAGAPGRRARTGMHQLHLFAFDEVGQPRNVAAHDQGVLRGERQRHMAHAAALQLNDLATTRRGHDRGLARKHQRLGHVDRAALDPAATDIQRRQDLQHHRQPGRRRAHGRIAGRARRIVSQSVRIGTVVHSAKFLFRVLVQMVSADIRTVDAEDGTALAYCATPVQASDTETGTHPGVVFLGGFMSDMTGQKAIVLEAWAQATGRAFLRLDYAGHGASGGAFRDGTIGRWCDPPCRPNGAGAGR